SLKKSTQSGNMTNPSGRFGERVQSPRTAFLGRWHWLALLGKVSQLPAPRDPPQSFVGSDDPGLSSVDVPIRDDRPSRLIPVCARARPLRTTETARTIPYMSMPQKSENGNATRAAWSRSTAQPQVRSGLNESARFLGARH